jgi:hypothetical protein
MQNLPSLNYIRNNTSANDGVAEGGRDPRTAANMAPLHCSMTTRDRGLLSSDVSPANVALCCYSRYVAAAGFRGCLETLALTHSALFRVYSCSGRVDAPNSGMPAD